MGFQAIVDEESEEYSLIPEQTRQEFLFKLFAHLVVGGPLCQFEDKLSPYINCVRGLYKDLLKVKKNKNSGNVEVVSHVYSISGVSALASNAETKLSRDKKKSEVDDSDSDSSDDDDDACRYFPSVSPFNISFVAIDPGNQMVWFYYYYFGKNW